MPKPRPISIGHSVPRRRGAAAVRRLAMLAISAVALGEPSSAAAGVPVGLPRHPSISPDGEQIVFSWRGDLWKAPSQGGVAIRLTSHPAEELASAWSRDGDWIAFESERDGFRNIHLVRPDGSGLRQLSYSDLSLSLEGFGTDAQGRPAVLASAAIEGDLFRAPRPYAIPLDGGPPQRIHDAFGSEAASSPDGRRVAFTRGGSSWTRRHYRGSDSREVWLFDRDRDAFTQLTARAGNDGRSRWVGDDSIAFLSDREGDTVNLFLLPLDGRGEPTPLTEFRQRDVTDFDVSADGGTAVLSRWNRLHRLDLSNPHAEPEAIELFAAEDSLPATFLQDVSREVSEAAVSPDGEVMAMIAFGDLHVRPVDERGVGRRVTASLARESDLAWSPDGVRLYFSTDEGGTPSIRVATVARTRSEIRDRYREATASPPAAGEAAPESPQEAAPETPPADPDDPAGEQAPSESTAPEADGGDPPPAAADAAAGESATPKPQLDPKRWRDAVAFTIEPVLEDGVASQRPRISPDGRRMLLLRGGGEIAVLDLASGELRTLLEGWDRGSEFEWSPDGEWVAVARYDLDFNRDVLLMPADGSAPPVNLTRHPGVDSRPRFSPDGRALAFLSDRVGDDADVWLVLLDPELERLPEAELAARFEEHAAEARKRKPIGPIDLSEAPPADAAGRKPAFAREDLLDAYRRLRRVTSMRGGEGGVEFISGGERIAFSGAGGGTESDGLYTVRWDGGDLKRISGSASIDGVSLDGQQLVLRSSGQARLQPVGGGAAKSVPLAEQLVIDRHAWNLARFDEAARVLGETFYLDPSEKGLDWPEVSAEYRELAAEALTASELAWVVNRLFGELNASHLGMRVAGDGGGPSLPQGRIGTLLEATDGGFRVVEVLPGSPAERSPTPLRTGDLIVAVEFTPLAPGETLEQRLQGRVGRETAITLRRPAPDGDGEIELEALLVPVSAGELRNLLYEETQRRNAALVHEWSGGRLGYTHVRAMNQQSLDEFERDLFAAAEGRDGLLIDVRNNGGGSTADRLLASIMVRPHAYTIPRGAPRDRTDAYPQDRLFIQRYTRPVAMLCNEKSFSNAEILSHAFKTLGRGPLVGMPTYGGVISTGSHRLVDGSTIRVPFRGWYLPDGTDMENHGAVPDLLVPQTPEDEAAGFDRQLRAAVDALLGEGTPPAAASP